MNSNEKQFSVGPFCLTLVKNLWIRKSLLLVCWFLRFDCESVRLLFSVALGSHKSTDCSSKCEPKKILFRRFTFFCTFVTTAPPVRRISAYLFLQIGSFFWSFRKFTKKSILKHFSCIFPYRQLIGEIEKISFLSTTYIVKNMPSKCLKNAEFYFLFFLLKK